jgi:hypothetical protein
LRLGTNQTAAGWKILGHFPQPPVYFARITNTGS